MSRILTNNSLKIKDSNGNYQDILLVGKIDLDSLPTEGSQLGDIPVADGEGSWDWDKPYADSDHVHTVSDITDFPTSLPASDKGMPNGVAELDENGYILTSQLPSYVDNVDEYESMDDFPETGRSDLIYVDKSTNKIYRWSGTTYVALNGTVALGETAQTAYRGDRGKTAYDHSQADHAPVDAQKNVQSDWNATSGDALILNKPESLPANGGNSDTVNNHTVLIDVPENAVFTDTWRPLGTTSNTACAGNDSRLSDARPSSDVPSWAKASSKPTYTATEVGAAASVHTHSKNDITDFPESLPADGGNADTLAGRYESEFQLVNGSRNLWNEQWEVGSIDGETGLNQTNSNAIRSTGYISVDSSTKYYSTKTLYLMFYNINKEFLSYIQKEGLFTTPTGTKYLRLVELDTSTYSNDIAIIEYSNIVKKSVLRTSMLKSGDYDGSSNARVRVSINPPSAQPFVKKGSKVVLSWDLDMDPNTVGGFILFNTSGNIAASSSSSLVHATGIIESTPVDGYICAIFGKSNGSGGWSEINPSIVASWNPAIDIMENPTYQPYFLSNPVLTNQVNNIASGMAEIGEIVTNDHITIANTVTNIAKNGYGEQSGSRNLLKPILQTTTQSDVTCTNNGDGTYTLNGTASATVTLDIISISSTEWNSLVSRGVKLVGCPSGGSLNTYVLYTNGSFGNANFCMNTNGVSIGNTQSTSVVKVRIQVSSGQVCNNLVFKPMITEDSTATYNDFEPYYESNKTLTDNSIRSTELAILGYECPKMDVRNFTDNTDVFHQRVNRVDLGSLDYSYNSTYNFFFCSIPDIYLNSAIDSIQRIFSNDYQYAGYNTGMASMQNAGDKTIYKRIYSETNVFIKDTTYTDTSLFKESLKGKYLYYELADEKTYSTYNEQIIPDIQSDLSRNGYGESGGQNIWDEKWEVGGIAWDTGETYAYPSRIRSIGFVAINPSTTYFTTKNGIAVVFYDSNKAYVSAKTGLQGSFNSPSNAYYLKVADTSTSVYLNDIAIIEGTSGTYSPHFSSNKSLTDRIDRDFELGRFGYFCPIINGVKNFVDSDGLFHRRIARVDLGSLTWILTGSNRLYVNFTPLKSNSNNIYCSNYRTTDTSHRDDKTIVNYYGYAQANVNCLQVTDSAYSDVATFTNSVKGIYLYFELQTEETYSAYDTPSIYEINETNNFELERFGYVCPIINGVKNFVDNGGVIHRRIIRKCLADFDYNVSGAGNFFTSISGMVTNDYTSQASFMSKYAYDNTNSAIDKTYWNNLGYIYVRDTSFDGNTTNFKNSLKDVYIYFVLATEETYSVYDTPSIHEINKTNNFELERFGYACPIINGVKNFVDSVNVIHRWIKRTKYSDGLISGLVNTSSYFGDGTWRFTINGIANGSSDVTKLGNMYMNGYSTVSYNSMSSKTSPNKSISNWGDGVSIIIKDSSITSVAELQALLDSHYIYYTLATEETYSAYNTPSVQEMVSDAWIDDGRQYLQGEYRIHENCLYKCLTNHRNMNPKLHPEYWQKCKLADIIKCSFDYANTTILYDNTLEASTNVQFTMEDDGLVSIVQMYGVVTELSATGMPYVYAMVNGKIMFTTQSFVATNSRASGCSFEVRKGDTFGVWVLNQKLNNLTIKFSKK